MLRSLYDKVLDLAGHRHATRSLAAVSFAESSFFPVPPDVMLAPMVLARPDRAWFYATVCTAASVLGGILGYMIGLFLEPLGMGILSALGKAEAFAASRELFREHGAWVILIKGLTPIPYKLITISAGVFQFNLGLFIALSVLTRAGRFFLVALVVKRWGPPMLRVVERRLALFTVLGLLVLAAGFVAVRFIH